MHVSDNVDHHVLMALVAERTGDRKALRLVSGLLRSGLIERHSGFAETLTATLHQGRTSGGRDRRRDRRTRGQLAGPV
jgi:RNA-directed DNA polymerase